MGSFDPSRVAIAIAAFLFHFVTERGLGYITGPDGGYKLDDETVLIPDVAFVAKDRLPEKPEREALIPPDLAVEVKSPTDRKRAMRAKAERYLTLGVRMVWLVFPEDQTIVVYTPDTDETTLGIEDVLSGGEVVPGFALPIRSIFTAF